ncbi:MAG: CBS domain-containing protein [Euryarchaeota archaeon]|nr:CBS domain-containing protein [Euryarchaeota archaeon]
MNAHLAVREVMTPDPVTVSPRMRLNHAAALMKERDVGSLIVVRNDLPVGIVTEKDLVEKAVAVNAKPSQLSIKDVMSAPLVTIGPEVDIAQAARMMASLRIRRLAVLENGRLVGILTEGDILKISPELIEITREFERINTREERIHEEVVTMGICEGCQAFSEELREHDGIHLCKSCFEDQD